MAITTNSTKMIATPPKPTNDAQMETCTGGSEMVGFAVGWKVVTGDLVVGDCVEAGVADCAWGWGSGRG